MKKNLLRNMLAATVALFTALFALPTTVQARTSYDLWIAGTQVTSDNCNDLSVIPGVSGTVEYDPDTRTLTLDNAAINAGGEKHGIYSKINDLTVKLIGTNTVTGFDAIGHSKSMTIKGSGTLNAEGSDGPPGIFTDETSLTIDGCTVNVKGGWGILGGNKGSTLTIRNATVTAEGTAGSIRDFKTLILDGCKITSPAGAVWNAEKRAVCDAWGHIIKSKVTIEPATTYRLYIAGTQVTSDNCNDLSVIDGVSGRVKYNPATHTLTLYNATINGGNYIGIVSDIDGLTVKLIGSNTVTSMLDGVRHTKLMTITGGGTLNAESTNACGIFTDKTSLTIKGCAVNAKGISGITGYDGSSESLSIGNATTVTAEGWDGSILNFKTLTLYEWCLITSPTGAKWSTVKHAVCDASGNIIITKVTIEPLTSYGLEIAGTKVTSGNRNDLSVIPGVSGTVKYDPDTRTLTLDNATINSGNKHGIISSINSSIDGLTMVITGTNTVTATKAYSAIRHDKPMTITGGGTLNVKSTNSKSDGFTSFCESLIIDGCTVNAKGDRIGFAGDEGTFTIRNATVTAESKESSICFFKTLILDGCKITSPAGAVWNATKQAVCDASGNVITDKITITRDTNGIETVTADVPAGKRGVYNLQGVRLGESLDRLPAGVYIYNGKKIIKK